MSHPLACCTAAHLAVPVLLCAQTPASGQTAPAAPKAANTKAFTPPKTPDGHPNLQGYWTNNTVTPLERPKGLGAKEFYTEAELTELQKKEKNRVAQNEEEGRPAPNRGTDADVHYDFSQYRLDREPSQDVVVETCPRTLADRWPRGKGSHAAARGAQEERRGRRPEQRA